jgi:hypothetical protein
MLIEAVPVRLVTVPLDGVPKTPPLTKGAPAEPTLTARAVATPVPKPDTPVDIGKPVALVNVPLVGVPNTGVTKVGEVAKTAEPVPVSSVKAERRLAELGVARKVATPLPRPDTPVEMGRPVAFVKVAAEGVPKSGVTKAGDVANTADPVPVSSVKAERRLALEGVAKKVATPVPKPLIPVLTGKPVALVKVAEAGVPRVGVTKVGELANTKAPEPVSSDTAEARLADDGVPRNVATPVPKDVIPVPPLATGKVPVTPVVRGRPVKLVATPDDGVPKAGVTKVGLVANTFEPEPVLVTETTFLLASNAKAVEAVKPDNVVVLDADRVVNAPAAAVEVPIGPLNESPTAPVWKSFN